ncbi:hypothetical protein FBEOM_3692 [Fusarium beomiforme]|uniref:Uncharacterized protein n=1 Tax=Fusarium beomiforme TaxID=44412 RepID=A0A9P5AP87_9HYPO|nr:hypothetical protein FBEOM_3692 [Fusarium beomiforme]
MATPLPIGAMPHNIPTPMHQQTQAPQPRPPIPQQNEAPKGPSAFMPVNTGPYSHPPAPPMGLRRQGPAELRNARSREPPMHRALRLEKTPSASGGGNTRDTEDDWEIVTCTYKSTPQSIIRDRIEHLDQTTRSVLKKKQDMNETIQLQLDRAQAVLTKEDCDSRCYYKLAQLESEYRVADYLRHRDDRNVRSSKKHRSHSKRSKSPKMETVAIVAYFQRMSADGQYGLRTLDAHGPVRQSRQIQQPPIQPRMGGLPPVALPQGSAPPPRPHPAPAAAAPFKPTPPLAVDPRWNSQPKLSVGHQNVPPMPQPQAAQQGPFNNAQQGGIQTTQPGNAFPPKTATAVPPPVQGDVTAGPIPRLPAINIPIRPPPNGPVPGAKAPPQIPPPGPDVPKGAFETGSRSPKKMIAESGPSVRNNIQVYHAPDRSSSPSDGGGDKWSDNESEGTRPSSIDSDRSPQRGRGRSPNPKQMHSDRHGNVIIQDPRNLRKDVASIFDHRSSRDSDRQHVRFNSPGRRYQNESCPPRRKYHSSREEPKKAESPRIVQAPRPSVHHVRGTASRLDDSYDIRPSRSDRPLERARLHDSHGERDVRRDNERFKHLEEDLRRRREYKERRDDRKQDDYKYSGSEPRWSDRRAREYMNQKEPRYSHRHHEDRETYRRYNDRRDW